LLVSAISQQVFDNRDDQVSIIWDLNQWQKD